MGEPFEVYIMALFANNLEEVEKLEYFNFIRVSRGAAILNMVAT